MARPDNYEEARSRLTEATAIGEPETRADLLAEAQTLLLLDVLQELRWMRQELHIIKRRS